MKISGSQPGVSSGHAVSAFGSCRFLSFTGETFNLVTVQQNAFILVYLLAYRLLLIENVFIYLMRGKISHSHEVSNLFSGAQK